MRINSYVSSSSREQLLLITFMNRFDAVISHPSVVPSDLAIQRPQCMEWIHFTFKFHTAPYLSIQSRLKLKMWNKTWNSIFCLALLIHFQSKYLIILVGFSVYLSYLSFDVVKMHEILVYKITRFLFVFSFRGFTLRSHWTSAFSFPLSSANTV